MTLRDALALVESALEHAVGKHPTPFHSPHEAFAVLLEEVDELKAEVWRDRRGRDLGRTMRHEVAQVAAVAVRFLIDLCGEEPAAPEPEPAIARLKRCSKCDAPGSEMWCMSWCDGVPTCGRCRGKEAAKAPPAPGPVETPEEPDGLPSAEKCAYELWDSPCRRTMTFFQLLCESVYRRDAQWRAAARPTVDVDKLAWELFYAVTHSDNVAILRRALGGEAGA